MKYLLPIIICLVSLVACNKATIKSVNTNNSKDSLTYQPKVAGSKWVYKRTIGVIQNTTYTFVRLAADTLAYNSTFQTFSSDDNATNQVNQYIRQDGDKYYSILTASTNKTQLLILDAGKNINESWLGAVNGSDTYTYTMKDKIPIYVLDGFTFKNVLVVHVERTGPNSLSGDTYYAQGVGQVQSIGTVNAGGTNLSARVKLITLDLK